MDPTPSKHQPSPWPLEPDEATVRSWMDELTGLLLEHLRTLPEQPAAGPMESAPDLARWVEPLPEEGAAATDLFHTVLDECVPHSFNTAGPGYLAYIPGGGLVPSALADLISNITNRYVGLFATAPLLVRLEMNVLRWFLDMVGFPAEARGILTSGGSLAGLIALVCARHRQLGHPFQDGVVYVSDQVHHSMTKAARFVGFSDKQVRCVETGPDLRLDPERVRGEVAADRRRGLRPAILVATAGTTNTGVVDDLRGLAEVAREERLWYHVDAAYGGFFLLAPSGKDRLRGIERADSVTIDPHKGLFLPYGTGCLLVRNGEDLRRPHASETGYLPPLQEGELAQDFCEYSPELSRDFRGLRVWLPLKLFGARAFREALEEKLQLARYAAAELRKIESIRVLEDPDLSLVAFGLRRDTPEQESRANRELLERVLAHRKVWMSGATVKGTFLLRICVLSFRTHREQVDQALDLMRTEL
ncbi:MAG: aminotransferase class I/II-fold pyridoxal phosphate-dependent enzyme [Planctomycetota bacterium]